MQFQYGYPAILLSQCIPEAITGASQGLTFQRLHSIVETG